MRVLGRQGIVYERVEVGPSAAHNVAVGGVQYAVGVHERILLYLVVANASPKVRFIMNF